MNKMSNCLLCGMSMIAFVLNFPAYAKSVAVYDFEDSAGTVAYDTERSGTLMGAAVKVYDAVRAGSVLRCSGTYGRYVSLGTYNPMEETGALTIAAWIKWDGPTGSPCGILSKRTDFHTNMMWTFGISSTSQKLVLQSTHTTVSSTGTIPTQQWVHVAVTLSDSGDVTFYLNGDQIGSATGFVVADGFRSELCLGSYQTFWYGLNGDIDEVCIYDTVLSESRIEQVISLDPAAALDLVARYDFENPSTTKVYDLLNKGTIKNSAAKVYDAQRDSNVLKCLGTYYNYASLGAFNPSGRTNELTIAAWIKWSGSTGYSSAILSKRSQYTSADMMWTFYISHTSHKLGLVSYSDSAASTGTIEPNQWVHVAVTVNSNGNVAFYINGQLSGTAVDFKMSAGTAAELCLGSLQGNWYCLNGYIDDVRLYDMALNLEAIERIVAPDLLSQAEPLSPIYKAGYVNTDGSVLKWLNDGDGSCYDLYVGQMEDLVDSAARLPGDVDADGVVDTNDLVAFAASWLGDGPDGEVVDFDGDGCIQLADFAVLAMGMGQEQTDPYAYQGTIVGSSYALGTIEPGQYFWRVDRIKNGQLVKGQTWSFVCGGSSAKEVFADNHVQCPVRLYDVLPVNYMPVSVATFNYNDSTLPRVWSIAQWYCDYSLENYTIQDLGDGALKYSDPMKSVTFSPLGSSRSDFTMEIDTRYQYGTTPRAAGEPWAHLLLAQSFAGYHPRLVDLSALPYHLEARLLYAERFEYDGYDPSLHAAQFQQFVTVQNLNPDSPGYQEYLWFGIGIYDDRYDPASGGGSGQPYVSGDLGTGALIYAPSRSTFTTENINEGNWVTLQADLLPHMYDALQAAWDRGFLPGSQDPNDYGLGDTNIGWEVPGINNVGMQFKNVSLQAIYN